MTSLIIGLTGGIGSGKTSVSNIFAEQGIVVVDADVIAREVVAPRTPALAAIVKKFGEDILLNGTLNRAELRERTFSNSDNTTWLNALLHPIIREQMQYQTTMATGPYCILSVPLLFENKLQYLVDRSLIVDISESIQIQRGTARDAQTPEQIKRIMSLQLSRKERQALADDIIDNNGSFKDLLAQVLHFHQKYLNISAKPL